MSKRAMRSVIRDTHDLEILQTADPVSTGTLGATGVWLPNPDVPSASLDEEFAMTAIETIGAGTDPIYLKVETNLNALGAKANGISQTIYITALPGVMVSLPLTVAASCLEDTHIKVSLDDGFGVAIAGNVRVMLHGYWDKRHV